MEKRVQVRYLIPSTLPLWEGDEAPPVISELTVAHATGGTIFHVSAEQWEALMQWIGGWPIDAQEREEAELAIRISTGKPPVGQGVQRDVAMRRAIEAYAMQRAITHYQKQGWRVFDVSSSASFDLRCMRHADEELHVEVKGTTTEGVQMLLTANEVKHARSQYPNVALFLVAEIQVRRSSTGDIQASEGRTHVLEPWNIEEAELAPVAFTCTLPKQAT